jgi:hypothetical protein
MVTGGMSEEEAAGFPVDLSALPKAELFTSFFQPAVRSRVRVSDGIVMHSRSSFGPEMSGVIASGTLFGLFLAMDSGVYVEEVSVEAPVEPGEHDPLELEPTEIPK